MEQYDRDGNQVVEEMEAKRENCRATMIPLGLEVSVCSCCSACYTVFDVEKHPIGLRNGALYYNYRVITTFIIHCLFEPLLGITYYDPVIFAKCRNPRIMEPH